MHLELVILALLVAVAGLAALARIIDVPYPILLVIGGLALGFIPGAEQIELDPDLVLLIFLPPLLYAAAFFANSHELRRNARPIGLLAIGLVVVTTAAVAVVAHVVIGLGWAVAFVLGAVVSPTDAVAPAEIVRRLGVPRRITTIVEGENLTNDWTALTIYGFAVAAVVTGSFSFAQAGPKFLLTGLGGLAIGVAAGFIVRATRRRVHDPLTEITISLLTCYLAYLPAEELGLSGVIAAVTVGTFMGWHASELTTPTTRIQLFAIWEVVQFLLNAVLFVLVGLQLRSVVEAITEVAPGGLIRDAVLVSGVVIVTRIVWVFVLTYAPRALSASMRARDPYPGWRNVMVVAWCSMRGAVALAAALAIPLTIDGGAPFPDRNLLIFLTFAVILSTLVLQGLTLAPLVRALGVRDDGADAAEEVTARLRTAEAALLRIDELSQEEWVYEGTVTRARALFDYRRRRFTAFADDEIDGGDDHLEDRSGSYRRFMKEVIAAERGTLLELRNEGEITDEVQRRVELDLDLEEARLDS